jgi:hypothetical protein
MRGYRVGTQSSDNHSNDLDLLWQIRCPIFREWPSIGASGVQEVAEFERPFKSHIIPRIVAAAISRAENLQRALSDDISIGDIQKYRPSVCSWPNLAGVRPRPEPGNAFAFVSRGKNGLAIGGILFFRRRALFRLGIVRWLSVGGLPIGTLSIVENFHY